MTEYQPVDVSDCLTLAEAIDRILHALCAHRDTDEHQAVLRDLLAAVDQHLVLAICQAVGNEDDHAHFNRHRLSHSSQGVAPGERVPAIRTRFVWAALAGALRRVGVEFPEAYRRRLDPPGPPLDLGPLCTICGHRHAGERLPGHPSWPWP